MKKKKIFNVIGIMTGTSMDGIDISNIKTDGINKVKILKEKSYQYSLNEQIRIKKINITNISNKSFINFHDVKITNLVIKYLNKFLKEFNIIINGVDYISLSGQTILHIPNKNISLQLGNELFSIKILKLVLCSSTIFCSSFSFMSYMIKLKNICQYNCSIIWQNLLQKTN